MTRTTRNTLLTILVASLIIFTVYYYIYTATPPPRYLCTVEGVSMEPTLHSGDQVWIQAVAPSQIIVGNHYQRTGDIIGFNATVFLAYGDFPYTGGILLVLHRAVDRTYQLGHYWLRTQGDNEETNYMTDKFSWEAYQTNASQPIWWGSRGWLQDTLILGKVVEIIPQQTEPGGI